MKKWFLLILVAAACGGKLSDAERKRLHEGMRSQEIRRIPEAELFVAAKEYGSGILNTAQKLDPTYNNKKIVDSLSQSYGVKISTIMPSQQALQEIEKQLVEAYVGGGAIADNVQRLTTDSLLLTRPIFREQPDGSQEFMYAIAVRMPVKRVVLSMPN